LRLLSSLSCILVMLSSLALGADVTFKLPPSAVKSGKGAKISFEVSAATDVEVTILNAQGKVIRHLVAGMLGKNAPALLQKDSLKQQVVWDGLADWDQAATGGPFKVQVRIGMQPSFKKLIGDSPASLGIVSSVACNQKNGELFVFHLNGCLHPSDSHCSIAVFSRQGKYLRTILPWAAETPVEKLAGLKRVKLADESTVPFFYQAETRSILPGAGNLVLNGPVVTADDQLIFVGHQEMCRTTTRYNQPGRKVVTCINTDGSMPAGGIFKTLLNKHSMCSAMLALSTDGKTFYATGIYMGRDAKRGKAPHAVYRFALEDKESKVFLGQATIAGKGPDGFNRPLDVAVDKDDNIYVADNGNNRIAVFDSDGKHKTDLSVKQPKCLEVDLKTGSIYVLSGPPKGDQNLTKFKSLNDKTPAISIKLGTFRYPKPLTMALDYGGDKPILWIASPSGAYFVPRFKVMRLEDLGNKFSDMQLLSKLSGAKSGVGSVNMLSYDRVNDRLIIRDKVYDPATGKLTKGLRCDGKKRGMGSVGLDGKTYLMSYPKNLSRFDASFKKIPFVGGKKGQLQGPEGSGSLRLRTRGVTADPSGNFYALWQFKDKQGASYGVTNYVTSHEPDGKIKKLKFIDSDTRAIHSPRLDAQGNFYLAVGCRPKGQSYPKEIDGQDLGKAWNSKGFNTNDINWYHLMYGCIVKFPKEGGTIRKGSGGVPVEFSYGKSTEIKGAKWIYYGASPVPSWRMKYPDTCLCESSRFDVDGWGRSFFPDTARFKVGVLDTAGNLICRFGDYGNVDDMGGAEAKPQIPLMWSDQIAVGAGVVYCGDRYNNRVVAVELKYAASKTVDLK
jgi:DNA-binding beta-propeller fold protein YncE